jgi:hypothetical protein
MTDPLDLWASQPVAPMRIAPEVLERRARGLERRVGRRNAIEYGAGGAVVLLFGAMGVRAPDTLYRIACAAIVLGVLVVMWSLHRRGAARWLDASAAPVRDHYRAELVRQRNALAAVWRWYLAPLIPGLALFFAAIWRSIAIIAGTAAANAAILPAALICVVVFAGIHWLNRIAARRLNATIAALDAAS